MKQAMASLLLTGVLGLAAVEWVAAADAYRDRLDLDDWQLAAEAVAPLVDAGEPVFVADGWLAPVARSHLPWLASTELVAPPDLRGIGRFHVLGFDGHRWSDDLQTDLEDLPTPRLVNSRALGDLSLATYEIAGGRLVRDLTAQEPSVETASGQCRGGGPWKCKEGRVQRRIVEVDYRPRSCLEVDLTDGVEATLTFHEFEGADRIRGHVGFSDFNGRLRSDAPAVLELEQSGDILGRWVIADEQGWHPIAAATAPGRGPVVARIRAATRGTWGRKGYDLGRARPVCIELRALQEGA